MLYEQGMDSDFVLLCPQLYADVHWDVDRLNVLTQYIINTYRIDESRIYITGLSRGGFGAWEYAVSYPDLFAAVIPIAARDVPGVERLATSNIAIFHGALDDGVPWQGAQYMYNRLVAVGANVQLTLFDGVGHAAWVPAYDLDGLWAWILNQQNHQVSIAKSDSYFAQNSILAANYPNPFNPSTVIHYTIARYGKVSLKVFDVLGREVFSRLETNMSPGAHWVIWDGTDNLGNSVGAGVYFCHLQMENQSKTIKILYAQ
jgi:pimeloyl-ACP methyl ester carboxylesterase